MARHVCGVCVYVCVCRGVEALGWVACWFAVVVEHLSLSVSLRFSLFLFGFCRGWLDNVGFYYSKSVSSLSSSLSYQRYYHQNSKDGRTKGKKKKREKRRGECLRS
jgi:hypothetical protein